MQSEPRLSQTGCPTPCTRMVHPCSVPWSCLSALPGGPLGTTEEERKCAGSRGQGLGRLRGWKRVGRGDRVKGDCPSWERWVQETLTPCLASQPLQCSPIHSPECGCSRALGPSAQALAHRHHVPPRLPSVPCSCCSPSLVSPEASRPEPSAAGSLWGRRWRVSCLRGEECCSFPWCQHSTCAGRGRDRTACAAAVTQQRCQADCWRVQRCGTPDGHGSGHGFLRTRSGNASRVSWFCGSNSCWP